MKNPYSLINLPIQNRTNEDWEILLNCYALGYDTHNNIMISNGGFVQTELPEIRARFRELKRIARKYAPQKLRTIEAIENLCVQNHSGKVSDTAYIHRLRLISLSNGVNPMLLDQAEARINTAERYRHQLEPNIPDNNFNKLFKEAGKVFQKNRKSFLPVPSKGPSIYKPHKRRGSGSRSAPDPRGLIRRMFGVR
jgi:hypothetical protein